MTAMTGAAAPTTVRARVAVLLLLVGALTGCTSSAGSTSGRPPPSTSDPAAGRSIDVADADQLLASGTCRSGVCSRREVAIWRQVAFTPRVGCGGGRTCRLHLDVLAPTTGGRHPVVVLLAGGPSAARNQVYVNAAAFPLAARGVVVLRADWRQGAAYGGGWPASFRDAACAVGVARRIAARYGGRPDDVVLAGHSLGGWVASVVALTPQPFTPPRGTCDPTAGSLRPDAVVTLAGAVDEIRNQGMGAGWLGDFFGGTQQARPAAWAGADPLALAARHAAGRRPATFTLLRGGKDKVVSSSAAPDLRRALRSAGYRTRFVDVPGADHDSILTAPAATTAVLAAT